MGQQLVKGQALLGGSFASRVTNPSPRAGYRWRRSARRGPSARGLPRPPIPAGRGRRAGGSGAGLPKPFRSGVDGRQAIVQGRAAPLSKKVSSGYELMLRRPALPQSHAGAARLELLLLGLGEVGTGVARPLPSCTLITRLRRRPRSPGRLARWLQRPPDPGARRRGA